MSKLKESYKMDAQMHHDQVMMQQEMEEYYAQQAALPEHKRDGYAEMMAEMADIRRKELREESK